MVKKKKLNQFCQKHVCRIFNVFSLIFAKFFNCNFFYLNHLNFKVLCDDVELPETSMIVNIKALKKKLIWFYTKKNFKKHIMCKPIHSSLNQNLKKVYTLKLL